MGFALARSLPLWGRGTAAVRRWWMRWFFLEALKSWGGTRSVPAAGVGIKGETEVQRGWTPGGGVHPLCLCGPHPINCRALSAAWCMACSALRMVCFALRCTEGLSIAPAASMEVTAPATKPAAAPETNGDTRIVFRRLSSKHSWMPALSVCPAARQNLHPRTRTKFAAKNNFILRNRLFTNAGAYSIIQDNRNNPPLSCGP